jgi:hypothetical protein
LEEGLEEIMQFFSFSFLFLFNTFSMIFFGQHQEQNINELRQCSYLPIQKNMNFPPKSHLFLIITIHLQDDTTIAAPVFE